MRSQVALFLVFSGCLTAFGDTLTLRDGTIVDGTYVGGDSRHVKMLVGSEVKTYELSTVHAVTFGEAPAASATPAQSDADGAPPRIRRRHVDEPTQASSDMASAAPAAPAAPSNPPGFTSASGATSSTSTSQPAAAPAATSVSVPTGTQLVIRLTDPVDSQKDQVGKTYRATLDSDVVVNGQTIIPRGADVTAKLLSDEQSGKITGKTILTLALTQVQVNGQMRDIDTTAVNQESKSRGKRSAETIGGGSALGAIIGAIAGGGAGAAIGAAAGAAAGTGVQVLTKGERVKIPAETRLTFSLQEPLTL